MDKDQKSEPYDLSKAEYFEAVAEMRQQSLRRAWARISKYREEISVADKIIAERDRLIGVIPNCPVHGQCVPYAIEWVEKSILMMRALKDENEALRRGMSGDYDLDAWLEFSTGAVQKDADRHRFLRRHDFDIGSYHGIQEHNHQAWFEHISDESIDQCMADEANFAEENEVAP